MANSDGNGNGGGLTPSKIISICIALIVGGDGLSLMYIQNLSSEVIHLRESLEVQTEKLRLELERKTDSRYRAEDAVRDFRLVDYRIQKNEANIDKCIKHIDEHNKGQDGH